MCYNSAMKENKAGKAGSMKFDLKKAWGEMSIYERDLFAEKNGVSRMYIEKRLIYKTAYPGSMTIDKLARGFGVKKTDITDWFYG